MHPWWEGEDGLWQIVSHCKLEESLTYDVLGEYALEYDIEHEVSRIQAEAGIALQLRLHVWAYPSIGIKAEHHNKIKKEI